MRSGPQHPPRASWKGAHIDGRTGPHCPGWSSVRRHQGPSSPEKAERPKGVAPVGRSLGLLLWARRPLIAAAGQLPIRLLLGRAIVLPAPKRAPLPLEGEGRGGAGENSAHRRDRSTADKWCLKAPSAPHSHSNLNAAIGSIRDALSAGYNPNPTPTSPAKPVAAVMTSGRMSNGQPNCTDSC